MKCLYVRNLLYLIFDNNFVASTHSHNRESLTLLKFSLIMTLLSIKRLPDMYYCTYTLAHKHLVLLI